MQNELALAIRLDDALRTIRRLLDAPDLNLENMEEDTLCAVASARSFLAGIPTRHTPSPLFAVRELHQQDRIYIETARCVGPFLTDGPARVWINTEVGPGDHVEDDRFEVLRLDPVDPGEPDTLLDDMLACASDAKDALTANRLGEARTNISAMLDQIAERLQAERG